MQSKSTQHVLSYVFAFLTLLVTIHAADSTWIEGTITSVTNKPLRVSHVLLYRPLSDMRMSSRAMEVDKAPLMTVAADSNGHFRFATAELGKLIVRFVAPYHNRLDRYVLCSGGHTISLTAKLATLLTPSDVVENITIWNGEYDLHPRKTGKGLFNISYSRNAPTFRTISIPEKEVRYLVRTKLKGSSDSVLISGSQDVLPTPDEAGLYWSYISAPSNPIKISVNTNSWPKSKAAASINFISTDDATLDTLMRHADAAMSRMMPPGNQPRGMMPPGSQSRSVLPIAVPPFDNYSQRSYRVREVAALVSSVGVDSVLMIVPPRSLAWTIGPQNFYAFLMKSDGNRAATEYIDTLLYKHPVRRIIPPLLAASVAQAQRRGDPERGERLLARLYEEFPQSERTQEMRRVATHGSRIQVGHEMPAFEWRYADNDKGHLTANELNGVYTLLVVWNDTAQASSLVNELKRMQGQYQAQGFRPIGVYTNQAPMMMSMSQPTRTASPMSIVSVAGFTASHPWPTIFDDGSATSATALFDVPSPFLVLIGPDRKVLLITAGHNLAAAESILKQQLHK